MKLRRNKLSKIQVLDCTLRDGGYCNDFRFGFDNEKKIVRGLTEANIDIIECGFLMDTVGYDQDVTRFTSLDEVIKIIPEKKDDKTFVLLTDYGKYRLEDLPEYDGKSVDGLRVAFHKKDRVAALEECKEIKNKGYKVFVQAMVSLNYSDEEFLDLIYRVNELELYAFYIVDSFGMMKRKDLIRLFYLIEHNLNKKIKIGFHSHNNLQLAFSNAQSLIDLHSDRELIIDSSVCGMGRGAGNLNTELFVQYLNDNAGGNYDIKPLLSIIDEILNDFYQKNYWGYSLPNYLSATHNAHPNYAGYLDDKKTLTVENMNEIFNMMKEDKKFTYDKEYIEELYLRFMATGKSQEEHKTELINRLNGKTVLIIAPGKSSFEEKDKIESFIDENVVTVSVNYNYPLVDTDYIFLSNLRRFRELDMSNKKKCIVTSNIPADNVYYQTKYRELLCDVESVKDNAGLMAINFFVQMGVQKIYLAGFDGYSYNENENYGESKMVFVTRISVLNVMNQGMIEMLKKFSDIVELQFLTSPHYLNI
jgi:4-hydroxy 2-oxovalerate aldolase